jgi:2',3'-cyclic-nucleotide 2'-phosphodiesterase/3'-nucleotidase
MKPLIKILLFALTAPLVVSCTSNDKKLEIYATTDLHGMLLPFDNTEGTATDHSLANLASVIDSAGRKNIILLDNGDILQGDPLAYYYNFIDTTGTHVIADILNYLGYDAATAGNHDIETGHPVYDRVRRQYDFPLLAANAVDVMTGKPYFEPYTVIERNGFRVVVFGLITPSVPRWLPEALYHGIRFDNMVTTAREWMPAVRAENPDLVIGLFHSGMGDEGETDDDENSTISVAINVPGFDVIFCGHDHRQDLREVTNIEGRKVMILDGGSRAEALMNVTVVMEKNDDGSRKPVITGRIIPMNTLPESAGFVRRYSDASARVNEYTSEVIGRSTATVTTRDAFFGPSAFVDLIHRMQLDLTGAQVSLAAPLSFDQSIEEGELKIRDMYRLYRFENFLYTVNMTGEEIDRHLEHAAGQWFSTMGKSSDYMLNYRLDSDGKPVMVNGTARLRYPSYNFDSAMGISYTVDVSKPVGSRIEISSLSDGTPFSNSASYTVAVNSYRANGGGGHFQAAMINPEELEKRIIKATDRDLRYYMTEWIKEKGTISPAPLADWKIIPADWAREAEKRERILLFGNK